MYHRMILVVRGLASDLVHVSYMYIMYLIQDLHISFHFFHLKRLILVTNQCLNFFWSETVDVQGYSITNGLIYFDCHPGD